MSVKSKTLTYGAVAAVAAILVVGAAIALSPSLFFPSSTSQGSAQYGSLNIYLTDAPPSNPMLKYLLVNVTSVELFYQEGAVTTTTSSSSTASSSTSSSSSSTSVASTTSASTTSASAINPFVYEVPSNVGTNVNLTKLHGSSLLLGATSAPSGEVVRVVLEITGARAYYVDGSSAQLKVVADGKLMVPIHFSISSGTSTDLTVDVTPNSVHISQADVLTPVVHVTVVSHGPGTDVTTETAEVSDTTTTTTT